MLEVTFAVVEHSQAMGDFGQLGVELPRLLILLGRDFRMTALFDLNRGFQRGFAVCCGERLGVFAAVRSPGDCAIEGKLPTGAVWQPTVVAVSERAAIPAMPHRLRVIIPEPPRGPAAPSVISEWKRE